MRLRVTAMMCVFVLACAGALRAQTPDALHEMYESNQAFALRDAVEHALPPLFYRGVAAESMNQVGLARKFLHAFIATNPHSKDAFDAHELLGNLYFRNGFYREAFAELEAAHAEKPDSADVNNMLPLFRVLAGSPDMQVVQRKSTRLMRVGEDRRSLPVEINGKQVTYGFDTGAALSVMGEADARLLGLTVKKTATKLSESSGSGVPGVSFAVAEDLVIGGLHLRNVPFFVMQDTGEPFVGVPVASRGLIGLPVLLAMQAVRWAPAGLFEFGSTARLKEPVTRNLLFHGASLIVQVGVEDKVLTFSLDTGAVDTDLNEGFAKKFPELVAAGQKESRAITGMGGSNKYDSVLLGPVVFRMTGRDVMLKAPHVFVSHSLGNWDGNLGNDILYQAKTVTLDFTVMGLSME
ncbi:MAG TPA: aspartyl protease family protein [Terracidiphilus sp.]|jgi:predicted aspartyl protease|nr:aspartyl protease family protein [Terracidiphilus sp.]